MKEYVINLPVPLGSTVYTFVTTCGDFCLFQGERVKSLPDAGIRCDSGAPCHTRVHSVKEVKLNLDTVGMVVSGWGKTVFATPKEAMEAANAVVKEHRRIMCGYGFAMDENGYSVMGNRQPQNKKG